MAALKVKLVLLCVGGLVIFLAFQKYTNYISDKAVHETIVKISKQKAEEAEKKISGERKELEKKVQELSLEREKLTSERIIMEKERLAFNNILKTAIEKAAKIKETKYVQIQKDVSIIPGDQLDNNIRSILARHTEGGVVRP